MTRLRDRLDRLERKIPDRGPGLLDLEDTAEGRMNARRLIFLDMAYRAAGRGDPKLAALAQRADRLLGHDTREREAADTEIADRLEIERYGHTTYRRWSGWREVMIAEGLRWSELRGQGQARGPDHPLHRQHGDEYRESGREDAYRRGEPGAIELPAYHEQRCREYLRDRKAASRDQKASR